MFALSAVLLAITVLPVFSTDLLDSPSNKFPDPNTLWKLPPLNESDVLNAGLKTISNVKHTLLYNGSAVGRTYSHHAFVDYFDGRLWAGWSTALNDEDSMGQDGRVMSAVKVEDKWAWPKEGGSVVAVGGLLPNQTQYGEQNYTFWCNKLVRFYQLSSQYLC